jgi:hypothetical protein
MSELASERRDAVAVEQGLWALLREPVDSLRVAAVLLGLSHAAARLTANVIVASSPETDRMLDEMPRTIRSLAIATAMRTRRCYGEIHGPIVWSETLAARAASAGDPQLYVCATTDRAYDTGENRVLAGALRAVATAARAVERQGLARRSSELARHVRINGSLATRYAEHRSLVSIDRPPDRRDIRRARAGVRHRTYVHALGVLRRAAQPIGPPHLAALAESRTALDHALLLDVVQGLRDLGVDIPGLRPQGGRLVAGPIRYAHPTLAGPNEAGVRVGDTALDPRDSDLPSVLRALAGRLKT